MKKKPFKILYVGADLSVNGGIATVLKSYYAAYCRMDLPFDFVMVKTTDYQFGSFFLNLLLFVKASIKVFIFLVIYPNICILHIKSSAFRSFQRKFWITWIAHCFRKKIIFHLHSGKFQKMFQSGNALTDWQLRKVFQWSTRIIVLSKNLEETMLEHFPEVSAKITRIPNPVALPTDYPVRHERQDSKYHILYIGYLQELKGVRDLLQIAKRTMAQHPDWVFDIAGKGELQELVKSQSCASCGRIRFHGWADTNLRERLYRQCDIFILPSYVEGMPLGILEAMSYGMPVVSTMVGGIPDIIGDQHNAGILMAPGDVDGLIHALEYFYRADPLLCNDAVNQRIKFFCENQIYREVIALYAELFPPLGKELSAM